MSLSLYYIRIMNNGLYGRGDYIMKLVKVILRPEKTYALKDVLSGLGYYGITAKGCSGFRVQKKVIKQVYRGRVYEQRVDSVKREELGLWCQMIKSKRL